MYLASTDSDLETTIVIRGIEANVRMVKAQIETIVRNADLDQYNGISMRQKSRKFDLANIKLAAPTVFSELPQELSATFTNPQAPVRDFDAALLNAPGFQCKFNAHLVGCEEV